MAPKPYEKAEDVKEAYLNQTIDDAEARQILEDKFDYTSEEATTAVDGWEEAGTDDEDDEDEPA